MKTSLLSLIGLFLYQCIPVTLNAQETWYWQNPLPQGNHLANIIQIDENKLAAAGASGVFMFSTDKGSTWKISYMEDGAIMAINLFYVSQNKKFYSTLWTYSGFQLYVSSDFGDNWQKVCSFTKEYIQDIHFFDETKWIAISSQNKIKYTTDAGVSWNDYDSLNTGLNDIEFIDQTNGYIACDQGIILKTSDSGASWKEINTGTYDRIYKIKFYNSVFGIAGTQHNYVLMTTDGGFTWNTKTFMQDDYYQMVLDIAIPDDQNIIIIGGNDDFFGGRECLAFRSSDRGENWINISDQFSMGLSCITIDNVSGECYAAGYAGGIYKSIDRGFNWIKMSTGYSENFSILCTFDSSSFYAAGYNYEPTGYSFKLLYTDNGGESWQDKTTPDYHGQSIGFLDNYYGFMSSGDSVLKTTDGGLNWNVVISGLPLISGKVLVLNKMNILICEYSGVLYKSTDAGINWHQVNSGANSLRQITFKDSLNGLIISFYDMPFITTDGGETWIKLKNAALSSAGTLFGKNSIALATCTKDTKILISRNNGTTWDEKKPDSSSYISGIAFRDSMNGTAVGQSGCIFYTTDGGENWLREFSPTIHDLNEISYSKNGSGIITGDQSVILGTKPHRITEVRTLTNSELPDASYLSQNYPNPFNPSTTIKYCLVRAGRVILGIYDLLGREVIKLLDEEKTAGIYQIIWNASEYPSGVYFLRMQAGDFNQVKKMIFMK